ncbi:hypothetical protein AN958_09215 [Leucoagaricus sp. SymC.cos]|nr:hypothetical protein AN958_09215 [Leucoagaricus sp. SymC.cos]
MSPTTTVSDEYIREKLSLFQDSMLAGLRDVRLATPQRSGFLPREVQIFTDDCLDAIPPTHMLAVYAPKSDSNVAAKTQVTLFPAHEIVLASHCTNLPKLAEPSCPSVIPIVPLALPSPTMYPYLQNYLYTKNIPALEKLLLPASHTHTQYTSSLMRRLLAVHGLWGNASALGVIDAPFYEMIERVLASLHQALRDVHVSTSPA